MDGDPVEGEPSEPLTLAEIFTEAFPYYLAMGMSYDEFWRGSPSLVRAYRKAYEIKQKNDEWARHRLGGYVFEALLCAAPVIRTSFGKGKVEPGKYPNEPWPLTEKEAMERQQRDARERYDRMREKLMTEAKEARKRRAEEAAKKEASEDGGN